MWTRLLIGHYLIYIQGINSESRKVIFWSKKSLRLLDAEVLTQQRIYASKKLFSKATPTTLNDSLGDMVYRKIDAFALSWDCYSRQDFGLGS